MKVRIEECDHEEQYVKVYIEYSKKRAAMLGLWDGEDGWWCREILLRCPQCDLNIPFYENASMLRGLKALRAGWICRTCRWENREGS